jgi:predicted nucleotidyltransferase component of viral defense system
MKLDKHHFHPEIFDKNQLSIFPKLTFLKSNGFYLAGGTALALQLGHRTSVDLDFFNPDHFDSLKLFAQIENVFGGEVEKTLQQEDTLFCKIFGVDLSFFWYKYPLLKLPKIIMGVPIAGLEDVAAMKLLAIYHRPAKRDYVDIYFLLKYFELKEIFSFLSEKYPSFNIYLALRALRYFEDLENERGKRPIKAFDPKFSWEDAKKEIFAEVKKYQLAMIKK